MNELQQQTYDTLRAAAAAVQGAGLPAELHAELLALAGPQGAKLEEPCVVAVAGRVKAGKSTFVNALLDADLAQVGVTETTATITYFRYGRPKDPARPVRVYYRNKMVEERDKAFLDSLQGNDEETLRRAEGIERLEYLLENSFLRDVTLVDTPGTGAVVDTHQNRTAEFLRLEQTLRDRHDAETRELSDQADAVLYLMGQVPTTDARDNLKAFQEATSGQSRAFNAIGIMGKIDLDPEVLARRQELASKTASQLKDQLNTVAPVSAGLQRALKRLTADGDAPLIHLRERLRAIPPARLESLLSSERRYSDNEYDDCPVSSRERRDLRGSMDWRVFTTIAPVLADPAQGLDAIKNTLEEMAGFNPLWQLLEHHLFARSHLLRCYRVLNEARAKIRTARFEALPKIRERAAAHAERQGRFLDFVRHSPGDPATARELLEWIERVAIPPPEQAEAALDRAERHLGQAYHFMEEFNADFQALQNLVDRSGDIDAFKRH